MDLDQLSARESIRDLVSRYNLYGDTGRLEEMAALFAPDGVLEHREAGSSTEHVGPDGVLAFVRAYAEHLETSGGSARVFHSVGTHVIDLIDADHAEGRAYVQMLGAGGLEEWGHYRDQYRREAGSWRFARRRATTVGRA